MSQVPPEQLAYILDSAIQAPSADNHHRLRMNVSGDVVSLLSTDGPLPPAGGYRRALRLMSLGAFSENLAIAAARHGIGVEIELLPDERQPALLARVHLTPLAVQVPAEPLWEAIPARHANRRVRYRGPSLESEQRVRLSEEMRRESGCTLTWLSEPTPQRRLALRLMRLAETERFRSRSLHEEMFSAIRFDVGWRGSAEEGLPPGALGVERPLRPLFSALRHWPVMRTANVLGGHLMMGLRACWGPCWLAPDLGLVSAPDLSVRSLHDSGRGFQRLWLRLTRMKRVLQPFPAAALYAMPNVELEGVPRALRDALAVGWQSCVEGSVPLMLFRAGVAPQLPVLTRRPSLSRCLD